MTVEQLATIERLRVVLSAAGIRFWLRGGWAVDFPVGSVTRAHEDIDAVAWQRHRRRLREALAATGFRVVRETEKQIDFEERGVDVTFAFLTRDGEGRIVTHAIPEWTWRHDAPPLRWREITCR